MSEVTKVDTLSAVLDDLRSLFSWRDKLGLEYGTSTWDEVVTRLQCQAEHFEGCEGGADCTCILGTFVPREDGGFSATSATGRCGTLTMIPDGPLVRVSLTVNPKGETKAILSQLGWGDSSVVS